MQKLISDFMDGFYGYGNVNGAYWFIGMEEGCGRNWDTDVAPRFTTWDARGRKHFEDVREYHFALGIHKFWENSHGNKIKKQRTWARLIQTLLSAQGKSTSPKDVTEVQANAFGRLGSDTCLLELLPLPSPSIKDFNFKHLACENYEFFASRPEYSEKMKKTRIPHIQSLIREHEPRHVVLYGATYYKDWDILVNHAAWTQMPHHIKRCQMGSSYIWMVPHPAAWNLPKELFVELGEKMRASPELQKSGLDLRQGTLPIKP